MQEDNQKEPSNSLSEVTNQHIKDYLIYNEKQYETLKQNTDAINKAIDNLNTELIDNVYSRSNFTKQSDLQEILGAAQNYVPNQQGIESTQSAFKEMEADGSTKSGFVLIDRETLQAFQDVAHTHMNIQSGSSDTVIDQILNLHTQNIKISQEDYSKLNEVIMDSKNYESPKTATSTEIEGLNRQLSELQDQRKQAETASQKQDNLDKVVNKSFTWVENKIHKFFPDQKQQTIDEKIVILEQSIKEKQQALDTEAFTKLQAESIDPNIQNFPKAFQSEAEGYTITPKALEDLKNQMQGLQKNNNFTTLISDIENRPVEISQETFNNIRTNVFDEKSIYKTSIHDKGADLKAEAKTIKTIQDARKFVEKNSEYLTENAKQAIHAQIENSLNANKLVEKVTYKDVTDSQILNKLYENKVGVITGTINPEGTDIDEKTQEVTQAIKKQQEFLQNIQFISKPQITSSRKDALEKVMQGLNNSLKDIPRISEISSLIAYQEKVAVYNNTLNAELTKHTTQQTQNDEKISQLRSTLKQEPSTLKQEPSDVVEELSKLHNGTTNELLAETQNNKKLNKDIQSIKTRISPVKEKQDLLSQAEKEINAINAKYDERDEWQLKYNGILTERQQETRINLINGANSGLDKNEVKQYVEGQHENLGNLAEIQNAEVKGIANKVKEIFNSPVEDQQVTDESSKKTNFQNAVKVFYKSIGYTINEDTLWGQAEKIFDTLKQNNKADITQEIRETIKTSEQAKIEQAQTAEADKQSEDFKPILEALIKIYKPQNRQSVAYDEFSNSFKSFLQEKNLPNDNTETKKIFDALKKLEKENKLNADSLANNQKEQNWFLSMIAKFFMIEYKAERRISTKFRQMVLQNRSSSQQKTQQVGG